MFQAPTYLTNSLYLFHCLSFPILSHGFERQLMCSYCFFYMSALFLPFSSHKFYTFSHLRVPYFCFLLFHSIFFHRTFPLFPFLRAVLSSPSTLFFCELRRDYFTVCYSFRLSQSSRNVWLLTAHIPPYSPRGVVIMLILSTIEWCPLKVISNKISVFLSTDSQSTGSLTFLVSHDSVCSPQSSQHSSSYKAKELPPCLGDIIGAYCRKRQS